MPTAPRDAPDEGETTGPASAERDGPPAASPGPGSATSDAGAADVAESRIAAVEDRWRRAVADLDNLRKRTVREIESAREHERARVAVVFLPVVDGLEQAVAFVPADAEALRSGIDVVRMSAIDGLSRLGYPRIDEVGIPFDPQLHEVVSVVESGELPPQTVAAVVRPGYGTASRMLRPAGVVVTAARA
jgi:molecular chaperone GrpE